MEKFWDGVITFVSALFWFGLLFVIGYGIFAPSDSPDTSKPSSSQTQSTAAPLEAPDYDSYESNDYSETYEEPDYEPAYQSSYSSSYDMDCDDFDSWDEAQYHYENVSDDNLDGDDDGVACESLQ